MAVKRKTESASASTSAVAQHPAYTLSNILDEEDVTQLVKLYPTHLSNAAATDINRNQTDYVYVMNWLYQYRGFIKLQSEYFDADLFEMELLDPALLQDINIFANKMRLNLISTLQNSKLSSLANFEAIFRLWFGIETPLGGVEEEYDENGALVTASNSASLGQLPTFGILNINDKFTILAILMRYISEYPSFRSFVDKSGLLLEQLRITPFYVHSSTAGTVEEYYLLFEDTRLYKRTVKHSKVTIPRKRAETKPSDSYNFDVVSIEFELFYRDIYEFNEYYKGLGKTKSAKAIAAQLKKYVDVMFQLELKKRKVLTSRRKELQMAALLATRKRSSRLEAKEMKRQEEESERLRLQEEELKIAGLRRLEKRRLMQERVEQGKIENSRENRLKLRQEQWARSNQQTPTPQPEGEEMTDEVTLESPVQVQLLPNQVEMSTESHAFIPNNVSEEFNIVSIEPPYNNGSSHTPNGELLTFALS